MEPTAAPEFVIGQVRVLMLAEMTFFNVANEPTALANLDNDLNVLIPKLERAQALAGIPEAGPVVIRYYTVDVSGHTDEPRYLMEVGVPVKAGTQPAGEARVQTLPPCRCVGLLYWGSLEHIREPYAALTQAMKETGWQHTGEGREWHYHFEGDTSPNNIIGIYMVVRE